MLIVLRGAGAGYEAEHVARLFFPGASLAGEVCPFEDETADLVAAVDHTVAQLVFVRIRSAACSTACCARAPASARPGA